MKKVLLVLFVVVVGVASFGIGRFSKSFTVDQNEMWIDDELSFEDAIYLSNETLSELETSNQYETFFNLHQEVIELSLQLKSEWEILKSNKMIADDYKTIFKEGDIKLTIVDRFDTRNDLLDLKDLREAFEETHGEAYKKLQGLKENFNVLHMDLIIETYIEVIDVLNIRLNLLRQANEIMVQLNTRLSHYIES